MTSGSDAGNASVLTPVSNPDNQAPFPSLAWLKWFVTGAASSYIRIDAFGLSKQVAFSVVFALLPTFFVLMSMAALAEKFLDVPVTTEVRSEIESRAPPETQDFLLSLVDEAITETSATTLSISGIIALAFAIWAGTSGAIALIESTNRAYGVRNTQSFIEKRLAALLALVALTTTVVVSVVVSFFGEVIVDSTSEQVSQLSWVDQIGGIMQAVISILVVFLMVGLFYRFAPAIDLSTLWIIPGTVVTTVSWIVLLYAFEYVAVRLDFSSVYGAASGIMLLLYGLNFAGVIIIVGAIVNGVLGQQYDRKRKSDLSANPWKVRYVSSGQEIAVAPRSFQFDLPWKRKSS